MQFFSKMRMCQVNVGHFSFVFLSIVLPVYECTNQNSHRVHQFLQLRRIALILNLPKRFLSFIVSISLSVRFTSIIIPNLRLPYSFIMISLLRSPVSRSEVSFTNALELVLV